MFSHSYKVQLSAIGVALSLCLAAAVSGQSPGYRVPQRHYPPPFPTLIRPAEGSTRLPQMNNLKAWNLAMLQYLQDKNNFFPDMHSAAQVKKTLWRYVTADKGGVDPVTKRLYQPNPSLSHKSYTAISDPSRMILFYEAVPSADGTRAVGFVDGHCALILEREWPRVKRMSHIP